MFLFCILSLMSAGIGWCFPFMFPLGMKCLSAATMASVMILFIWCGFCASVMLFVSAVSMNCVNLGQFAFL